MGHNLDQEKMILDVGPETIKRYSETIAQAKTIVWNGPVGVFEWPQFANGTKAVASAVGASQALSIVGGGDTIAAIDQFNVSDSISYVSTGGGAFLQYLEEKPLPGVVALMQDNLTKKVISQWLN